MLMRRRMILMAIVVGLQWAVAPLYGQTVVRGKVIDRLTRSRSNWPW